MEKEASRNPCKIENRGQMNMEDFQEGFDRYLLKICCVATFFLFFIFAGETFTKISHNPHIVFTFSMCAGLFGLLIAIALSMNILRRGF